MLTLPARAIQEPSLQEIVIIKSGRFECLMDALNLYSDSDREEEKCLYDHLDSLSPTPSPQPSHAHLLLTQNHSSSTETEVVGLLSPVAKGQRRGRRGSEAQRNVNRGHWSLQENKRYHWFLEIHYSHFVNRHMRRMDKIFKSMEMFVGTRQAEQCRSHHQKMEKKYLNFTTIISNLRRLHYNTLDVDPVLEEINALGVHAIDGLATIEYLKQQQSIEPPELKERRKSIYSRAEREEARENKRGEKEEKKAASEAVEERVELERVDGCELAELRSQEQPLVEVNMLEDCAMNIGELSLYHRDENSSIFNQIFL